MNLRRTLFWLRDRLAGSPLEKHYSDIASVNGAIDAAEIRERQNACLDKLLAYATASTPFYEPLEGEGLDRFPVINKNVIRESYDQFRSRPYRDKPLIRMTTSGSTGTPFTVYQDLNKKQRNLADTLFFSERAGYRLGHVLFYLKIWSDNNRKRFLELFAQNIVPVDVLNFRDEHVEGIIRHGGRNKSIIGYASALDVLAAYLRRNRITRLKNIRSVIAISETLQSDTKDFLAECTGVPVLSRYSNLENGIIAQQCADCGSFHVNDASYVVEVLDMESDRQAGPGEAGRIVVTDLFNYAMPLIRYDTGDIGVAEESPQCRCRCVALKKIEGRKLDLIYNTSGELVSSYLVYKNMWKYSEIDQYQLIQEGEKSYRFRINARGPFRRERELRDEFLEYLGGDADFQIEYVQEIPLLNSGKRRKIVNNYRRRE